MPVSRKTKGSSRTVRARREAQQAGASRPRRIDSSLPERVIRFLLYGMIALIPAVFSTSLYTTFSAPKLVLLHVVTALILLIIGGQAFINEKFAYKKTPLNIFLLLYGAISLIATLTSIVPISSIYGTYGRFVGIFTVVNLLLITFVAANYFGKKHISHALLVSVITSGLLALYGLGQYFGYFDLSFNWSADPADRIFGALGHPNHCGLYLAMNFMLAAGLLRSIKSKYLLGLIYFIMMLQFLVVLLTASRAALIALIVGILLYLFVLAIKNREIIRLHLSRITLAVFIIISLLATGTFIFQKEIVGLPLIQRTVDTVRGISDGNIPDRLSWWMSGIQMVIDRPFFGYGLSTFRDVYNQYRRTDYRTLEQNGMEYRITPEAAHNEYVNLAATQGILGLLSFLLITFFVCCSLVKNYLKSEEKDVISLGLYGAIVVFLVDVFFGFGVVATYFIFYIIVGISLAHVHSETKITTRVVALNRGLKYIFALILIVVSVLTIAGSIRFALSEYHLKEAVKFQFEGNRNGAIENFEKAIIAKPSEPALHQAYADYALHTAAAEQALKKTLLDLAIRHYERTNAVNPFHPSTFFNLGSAWVQQYEISGNENHLSAALRSFDQSIKLAVNNPLYPHSAGVALMGLNEPQAKKTAIEYFQKTAEIKPDYLDTQAYIETLSRNSRPQ